MLATVRIKNNTIFSKIKFIITKLLATVNGQNVFTKIAFLGFKKDRVDVAFRL